MSTDAPRIPAPLHMLAAAAVRGGRFVRTHPATAPACLAALAGGALGCGLLQWTLRLGGDPAVTLAGRLACVVALGLAWAISHRFRVSPTVAGPAFAAAVAAGPALGGLAETILSGGSIGFARLAVAAGVSVGPVAFAAGLLANPVGSQAAARLIGAGVGAGLCGLLLAPQIGLQNAALACAAGAVAAAAFRLDKSRDAEARPGLGVAAAFKSTHLLPAAVALGCGGIAAAGLRTAGVYFPLSADVLVGRAACGAVAVGIGVLIAARIRRDRRAAVGGLVAAGGAVIAAAGGPAWVELNLWANATLSSPALLTDLRVLVAAAFLAPACVGAGVAGRTGGGFAAGVAAAFGLGICGGELLLTLAPDGAIFGAAVAFVAAATVAALAGATTVGVPRRMLLGGAASGLAACGFAFGAAPEIAPRVLFNVLPTLARQGGVTGPTLAELDDARQIAAVETGRDAVTLWRERGARLTVRHAGLPVSGASVHPDLVPRDSAAAMRAVLPLCLAESPRRVLLLGTPGPETLSAVTRFPVLEVVACDGRLAAVAAVRDALADQRAADPFADERVTLRPLDAPLAVRSAALLAGDAAGGGFDVILSDPAHPAAAAAAAETTAAFAARVAALLDGRGVYCARVRTTDFGPAPLANAAATLRTAFAEVRAVEVGRGEFALLATNAPGGLVDTRLGSRLDGPHVRRLLGECGWDWSVPLNLLALTPTATDELAATADPVTADDGRAAFGLPRAMLAWGDKSRPLAAAIGPLASRLLETAVPEIERQRVRHRLQEVVKQRTESVAHPDQPWMYRTALKERLTKSPRSVIRRTAAGMQKVRHPEDQRRVEYVEALAAANGLSDASLAHLETFAEPFDPLLAPSLPSELARLYGERGDRPAAQLRCLMKSVHFAPATDRGVRNVCEALALLRDHPEIIPDPAERYDAANGLLQVLKLRWETRGRENMRNGVPAKTGVALHDVRNSLEGLSDGLAALAEAGPAAGVPGVRREARADWLTRSLERPLKGHRATLHQTHRRRLGMRDAMTAAAGG